MFDILVLTAATSRDFPEDGTFLNYAFEFGVD
jgi:hypothetical protein